MTYINEPLERGDVAVLGVYDGRDDVPSLELLGCEIGRRRWQRWGCLPPLLHALELRYRSTFLFNLQRCMDEE